MAVLPSKAGVNDKAPVDFGITTCRKLFMENSAMKPLKILFIVLGTISLGLGILGIFIPGLPTTPFLLITAGLYLRSSDRLYQKIISNRYLGKYIHDFQSKGGMTLKQKLYSIVVMWTMIFISCYYFISNRLTDYTLIGVGVIGTVVMGFIVKTVKNGRNK